jgi:hypothetical protein
VHVATLLVACERCHKQFRSYAALENHWKQRHPNVPFPETLEKKLIEEGQLEPYRRSSHLGKRSRLGIAIVVILLVMIAIATLRPPSQTVPTIQSAVRSTIAKSMSNVVWDKELVLVNDTTYIRATLSPVSKTNYEAFGYIQTKVCTVLEGNLTCPRIMFLVLNQSGVEELVSKSTTPSSYAAIVSLDNHPHNFTLENLDYNGIYFFVFQNPNPPLGIRPVGVTISLLEDWTEMQTTTQTITETSSSAYAYESSGQDSTSKRNTFQETQKCGLT